MEVSGFTILLIFFITTCVVAITVVNAIAYNEIASDPEPMSSISKTNARVYFWLNIVVGFITFLLWCWCIYKWFSMKSKSKSSYKRYDLVDSDLDFDYQGMKNY